MSYPLQIISDHFFFTSYSQRENKKKFLWKHFQLFLTTFNSERDTILSNHFKLFLTIILYFHFSKGYNFAKTNSNYFWRLSVIKEIQFCENHFKLFLNTFSYQKDTILSNHFKLFLTIYFVLSILKEIQFCQNQFKWSLSVYFVYPILKERHFCPNNLYIWISYDLLLFISLVIVIWLQLWAKVNV